MTSYSLATWMAACPGADVALLIDSTTIAQDNLVVDHSPDLSAYG
jgi:hypothetical protein